MKKKKNPSHFSHYIVSFAKILISISSTTGEEERNTIHSGIV